MLEILNERRTEEEALHWKTANLLLLCFFPRWPSLPGWPRASFNAVSGRHKFGYISLVRGLVHTGSITERIERMFLLLLDTTHLTGAFVWLSYGMLTAPWNTSDTSVVAMAQEYVLGKVSERQ
jgi:hypothetical protein